MCNLKPSDSNEELEAPYLNWRQDLSSDSICSKVANFLVTFSVLFLGGQRNIKNLWLKSSWTGIQPNGRLRIRLELQIRSILKPSFWSELATERPLSLLLKPHALPLRVSICFLPSLDLPWCLLGCPRVSAISGQYLLVVVVVPPFIIFVVVSRHSVRRPSFKSAATLQGRACFPAVLHILVLGHIMPYI